MGQLKLNWEHDTHFTNSLVLKASAKAKLLSIADDVMEMNNAKKSKFYPATSRVFDEDGNYKDYSCIVWEKNKAKMSVGGDYYATLNFDVEQTADKQVFVKMSPIIPSSRAVATDFDMADALALLQSLKANSPA